MLDFPKREENKTHSYTAGALQVKMCYFTKKSNDLLVLTKNVFGFLKRCYSKKTRFWNQRPHIFFKSGSGLWKCPKEKRFELTWEIIRVMWSFYIFKFHRNKYLLQLQKNAWLEKNLRAKSLNLLNRFFLLLKSRNVSHHICALCLKTSFRMCVLKGELKSIEHFYKYVPLYCIKNSQSK